MTAKLKLIGMLTGAALLGGVGASAANTWRQPEYMWYDTPQTDSVRTLLNMSAPGTVRLKIEERTKRHSWITVVPVDTAATPLRLVAPFEVEESTWCPPLCLK